MRQRIFADFVCEEHGEISRVAKAVLEEVIEESEV